MNTVYLAVDLGASSGRVLAGVWDGQRLELVDIHRFATPSVKMRGRWHWDVLGLYSEILKGLRLGVQQYGEAVRSIGVDTWGVDYGLLDGDGELLANPVCYRDSRTDGIPEEASKALGRELIYAETGIQFMFFNTINQLAAEKKEQRVAYRNAQRVLFLPDLINYWLSGIQATERSIASTSQILNPTTGTWSEAILAYLDLDTVRLGDVVESGTVLGNVSEEVAEVIGRSSIPVVATAGHDTASSFMALPETREDFAILNSGTWSIIGLELKEANCSLDALASGFSNEIGFEKSVRFLKNICGFWLLEECKRNWALAGEDYGYEQLIELCIEAAPLRSLIDPDAAAFSKPCDMPAQIQEYCRTVGEPVPETPGQIVRCIFESLALKYAVVFEQLGQVTQRSLKGLFVLGGGARNGFLNQLTADALGVPVVSGAAEATAVGNVMAQMIGTGSFDSLAEARRCVSPSFDSIRYEPEGAAEIRNARGRFERIASAALAQ